jgi:hypothetical protein
MPVCDAHGGLTIKTLYKFACALTKRAVAIMAGGVRGLARVTDVFCDSCSIDRAVISISFSHHFCRAVPLPVVSGRDGVVVYLLHIVFSNSVGLNPKGRARARANMLNREGGRNL